MSFVPRVKSPASDVPSANCLAEFHPRFVLWTSLIAQLPMQLFFSFWSGGFFGGFLQTLLPNVAQAARQVGANPFVAIGGLVLIGFPVVTLSLKRLNYANTVYRLFPDHITIEEGFLTQHHKEIAISAVREINLRRGILQRSVGLGSVYVATQATGTGQGWTAFSALGASSTFGSGAMLRDLDNADEAYSKLTALWAQQREG